LRSIQAEYEKFETPEKKRFLARSFEKYRERLKGNPNFSNLSNVIYWLEKSC